jgi:hypothetical protein
MATKAQLAEAAKRRIDCTPLPGVEWSSNTFEGEPPGGGVWREFLTRCHERGVYSGLRISAIEPIPVQPAHFGVQPVAYCGAESVGGSLVHPDDAAKAGAAIGPNFNPMK